MKHFHSTVLYVSQKFSHGCSSQTQGCVAKYTLNTEFQLGHCGQMRMIQVIARNFHQVLN